MENLFLNKEHIARFNFMMDELSFTDLRDPYWRSLVFIFSGDERLFNQRRSLLNFVQREINSELWFDGTLSGEKQRLVALAYNLFSNQVFYEFEDGKRYNISPLEVFSGVDEAGYQLAKNAIDIRLQYC
ncbi:hypothetical protein B4X80_18270 [Listeria monocytogenes]|nr:hypothetical protein [Listeria monocytogenes]EAC9497146.1 hypothetical protein [Listeria monocytogenes]EAG2809525.1 hypothetical protein [Listeria monocytogenes]